MKVWTNTRFTGHWPVGTAAVVAAETAEQAAGLLSDALERCGLPQAVSPTDFMQLEIDRANAVVLLDGDY